MTTPSVSGSAIVTRAAWDEIVRTLSAEEPELCKRRVEPRRRLRLSPAKLFYFHRNVPTAVSVVILQASSQGVMVKAHERVPVNVPVLIDCAAPEARFVVGGEIRHCTDTVAAFKVGIRLTFRR